MTTSQYSDEDIWERIERAVESVKDRARRVAEALDAAQVPYAVVGGNAVQLWVAWVDEAAVRNTRDVHIALNRSELPQAIAALSGAGFVYRHSAGIDMFLDGPDSKARDAVHVVFAGEKVREEYAEAVPSILEFERIKNVRTLKLESLVQMKLTSFRRKDQVHIQDMISVGLIDPTWLPKFSGELRSRLQELLEDPEG